MFTRRSLLGGGLASLAGLSLGHAQGPSRARRVLRVAHLSDVHLTPESGPRGAFARCLDHALRVSKADMIFQGGDLIMDGLTKSREEVQAQYEVAARTLRSVDVPVYHCLGNHDVWGWMRRDRDTISGDPLYGKGYWKRFTGYRSTYYSFDRAGWHFVFLDSIGQTPRGHYQATLDEAQFRWLASDLDAVPPGVPVCVVSHVPFLIGAAQFFGPCEGSGRFWSVSGGMAHLDARRIKDLFFQHPQVNVCLSGHTHLTCRTDYNGVAHVTSGAVSGAWWRGDHQETKPGYGVVDFFSNGHSQARYETYA